MERNQKKNRLGEKRINNQGCFMIIKEYIDNQNITVEFQDEYKAQIHTNYKNFVRGQIKNPYYPSVYGVGIIGKQYPIWINNNKITKEYKTWIQMLRRCYNKNTKERNYTYKYVSCCYEWLLYENFYEWLHSQENFDKWYNNDGWHLDKDILIKNNKIYSPATCCLVPDSINKLFTKCDKARGNLPIGVSKYNNKFQANCMNPLTKQHKHIGYYFSSEDAFYLGYKPYKENIIKQVAQIEYEAGNITEQCYKAMINYEVEITD